MKIKLLLIAELEVAGGNPLATAQAKLDAFREAVQPAAEYGLTLYRATAEDLVAFIGPLWKPIDGTAATCERCQRESVQIGDCGYCPECCELWCTHENCDRFTAGQE